ncbi:hypothetical protein COP1_003764 [Malus domestica]
MSEPSNGLYDMHLLGSKVSVWCGVNNISTNTRGAGQIILEAHQDFHAHSLDNNDSIKEESKVIKMVFIQNPLITPHQILIQKVHFRQRRRRWKFASIALEHQIKLSTRQCERCGHCGIGGDEVDDEVWASSGADVEGGAAEVLKDELVLADEGAGIMAGLGVEQPEDHDNQFTWRHEPSDLRLEAYRP